MLDSLSVPVPSFSSLLILGGLFLLLVYLDSRSKLVQTAPLEYDQLLISRLNELGMPDFASLQKKLNLTYSRLRQVRCGDLSSLPLKELTQLATALNWTLERSEER